MSRDNIYEEVGHVFMLFFVILAVLMVLANNLDGVPSYWLQGTVVPLGLESAVLAILGLTSYSISWRIHVEEKRRSQILKGS